MGNWPTCPGPTWARIVAKDPSGSRECHGVGNHGSERAAKPASRRADSHLNPSERSRAQRQLRPCFQTQRLCFGPVPTRWPGPCQAKRAARNGGLEWRSAFCATQRRPSMIGSTAQSRFAVLRGSSLMHLPNESDWLRAREDLSKAASQNGNPGLN